MAVAWTVAIYKMKCELVFGVVHLGAWDANCFRWAEVSIATVSENDNAAPFTFCHIACILG